MSRSLLEQRAQNGWMVQTIQPFFICPQQKPYHEPVAQFLLTV